MKTIAAVLLAVPCLATAQTYDLASDFSATLNPAGTWQYGWTFGPNASLNFSPYTDHFSMGSADIWFDGSYAAPAPGIFHNASDQPVMLQNFVLGAGVAAFQPGPNDELSAYRWRAPETGEYHLDVTFTGIGSQSTTDVFVLAITGGQLFLGVLGGIGSTLTFNGTYTVPAGAGFDFMVSNQGGNYIYGADATSISARLTMVPEPRSAVLGGLGLAALLGLLRRR